MVNKGVVRQWYTTYSVATCVAITATVLNWLAPYSVQIAGKDGPIKITDLERTWLTVATMIGGFIVSIPVGFSANKWGRKPVLWLIGPVALFSWVLLIITKSIIVFFIASLVQGFISSTTFGVYPMYIAEIASPKNRGVLCGAFMTFYFLGMIVINILGYFMNFTVYLYALTILPIFYTINLYFLPESPYYLILSGKDTKAIEVLTWLNPNNYDLINEQFIEMKASIDNKFSYKNMFNVKSFRSQLIINTILYCLQLFAGLLSLQMSVTEIFSNLTGNAKLGLILTIILNTFLCCVCFLSGFIADIFGRRPAMYVTSFIAGIFHLLVAIYFFIFDSNVQSYSTINMWIVMIAMLLALILNNISLAVFITYSMAENFKIETRPLGTAIVHSFSGISALCSIIVFQLVQDNIGNYFNFLIFAFSSISYSIIIIHYGFETARKPLELIQKEMEK